MNEIAMSVSIESEGVLESLQTCYRLRNVPAETAADSIGTNSELLHAANECLGCLNHRASVQRALAEPHLQMSLLPVILPYYTFDETHHYFHPQNSDDTSSR
jgi:hypothetical protein